MADGDWKTAALKIALESWRAIRRDASKASLLAIAGASRARSRAASKNVGRKKAGRFLTRPDAS